MPKGVENVEGLVVVKNPGKRKEYSYTVSLDTFVDLIPIIEDNDAASGFDNEDGTPHSVLAEKPEGVGNGIVEADSLDDLKTSEDKTLFFDKTKGYV